MAKRPIRNGQGLASPAGSDLPHFSPSFVNEVRACASVDEFVELMEERGIWLNRNAADRVFRYLRFLGDARLSDDDLDAVSGGAHADEPIVDGALRAELENLAKQLRQR